MLLNFEAEAAGITADQVVAELIEELGRTGAKLILLTPILQAESEMVSDLEARNERLIKAARFIMALAAGVAGAVRVFFCGDVDIVGTFDAIQLCCYLWRNGGERFANSGRI